MRLQPRNPPGHANRKARRYANDIRRLRAEGHTYETIRLALLDAGVSVSISTVIREANRPPSQWALEQALAEPAVSHEVPSASAAAPSGTVAQAEATTATLAASTSSKAVAPAAEPNGGLPRVTWLAGLVGVLRRLRRARTIA